MRSAVLVAIIVGVAGVIAFAGSPSFRDEKAIVKSLADLSKLTRVTDEPFKMDPIASTRCDVSPDVAAAHDPHSEAWCHVFVNAAGQETLKSGKGTYAVGTVIVKQKFRDAEAKKPALFTVMRKMEAGYDAEHGDWEYSIVDRSGERVLSRGKIDSCIECHTAHKDTDYITRLYLKPAAPKVSANEPPPK